MACFSDDDKHIFPIKNIEDFVKFFTHHLDKGEPNLTLLSIVLGFIENSLTVNRTAVKQEVKTETDEKIVSCNLPLLELPEIEALYHKFSSFIKGSIDLTNDSSDYTSRDTVTYISNLIWSGLNGNYTDKAHLQSLFSYLTGTDISSEYTRISLISVDVTRVYLPMRHVKKLQLMDPLVALSILKRKLRYPVFLSLMRHFHLKCVLERIACYRL